jgi:membrane-associated phospholipid phosphatase
MEEQYGTWWAQLGYYGPLTLFIYLIALLIYQGPHCYAEAFWVVPFSLAVYYINVVLKNFFQQPRPSGPLPTATMGYFTKHKYYGFPSGHAQLTVALATYIWVRFPTLLNKVLMTGQVCLTSFQRWYYLRHTVWQILVGSFVGGGLGYYYVAGKRN